jgi:hypothetical protein
MNAKTKMTNALAISVLGLVLLLIVIWVVSLVV